MILLACGLRSCGRLLIPVVFASLAFGRSAGVDSVSDSRADSLVVDSIFQSLSLRQKVAQMVLVYHSPVFFIQKHQFGGVLVMSPALRRPEALRKGLDTLRRTLPVPLLVTLDQEGGKVNRLGRFPQWKHLPSAKEMRTWPPDSVRALARQVARKMRSLGINTNLAPVLDPSVDPDGQPTFMEVSGRSFGSTAESVVPTARAFALGMADEGVLSVAKHYPGYDSRSNSDHEIATSDASREDLSRTSAIFREMAPHVQSIMLSSVRFHSLSQSPAVFEPIVLRKARQDAPRAILMTDDLWGVALRSWISGKEEGAGFYSDQDFRTLVLRAVLSGNDMLMITYPIKAVELIDLLEREAPQWPELLSRIEASSRHILQVKWDAGLFEPPARIQKKPQNRGSIPPKP